MTGRRVQLKGWKYYQLVTQMGAVVRMVHCIQHVVHLWYQLLGSSGLLFEKNEYRQYGRSSLLVHPIVIVQCAIVAIFCIQYIPPAVCPRLTINIQQDGQPLPPPYVVA